MYVQPYFPQFSPLMQKTKQAEKKPKEKPYEVTPLDYQILLYVREYHFLTAWQLVKLHYSNGSLTRARVLLLRLYDAGYLDRRALPHVGAGQPTYIYALGTKGINYLKEQGYTSFSRYRPNELQQFKYPHLEHVLSLNDVLIAARRLQKVASDISLEEMRHDLDLKRSPAKVEYVRRLPGGDREDERITIIPDGWLDFRLQLANSPKKRRKCIVLELDRGSETNMAEFKKKIRAYVYYAYPGGPYEQMFGTQTITVAYLTTAGENRLRMIKLWCEQELREQRLEHEAGLFRFSALPYEIDPDTKAMKLQDIDSKRLYLSEVWFTPFEPAPGVLLWKALVQLR
jgi:hypothetical protein